MSNFIFLVCLAFSTAGGSESSRRLLRPHQVPDGPEDDDRASEVQLLLQQAALHRRHPTDHLQLPGLQRAGHRVLQLRRHDGEVRHVKAEGPRISGEINLF